MKRPFKYITKFTGEITASSSVDDPQMNITEASLESLRPLIPDDIDFEQNVDLVAVAFNAAVVNLFNKNGDGIDTATDLAVICAILSSNINLAICKVLVRSLTKERIS